MTALWFMLTLPPFKIFLYVRVGKVFRHQEKGLLHFSQLPCCKLCNFLKMRLEILNLQSALEALRWLYFVADIQGYTRPMDFCDMAMTNIFYFYSLFSCLQVYGTTS